jgi:hypothetical protein
LGETKHGLYIGLLNMKGSFKTIKVLFGFIEFL